MVEAPVSLEPRASRCVRRLGLCQGLADAGEMAAVCLNDEVQRFALKELVRTVGDKCEEVASNLAPGGDITLAECKRR